MAAEMVSWDWKAQVDIGKLAEVVARVSGGQCHIREVDTHGDYYGLVVSDAPLTAAQAEDVFFSED